MAACHGNGEEHCCHLGAAGVCAFLEERTVPGRRWACGLRRELGSWAAVHATPRYRPIRALLRSAGVAEDCGDWPPPGHPCGAAGCGVTG